jgi:Ca2+-binding EF-hand superfamily protein
MNGLRAAFDFFDTNKDGHINMEELANALRLAGHNPTMSEVKEIFEQAEGDSELDVGKGYMDFKEFARLADTVSNIDRSTPQTAPLGWFFC